MYKFGTNTLHDMNTHTLSLFELSPPFSAFLSLLPKAVFLVAPDGKWQACFACCISFWNHVLELVYAELTSCGLQTAPKRETLDRIKTLEIFST